MPPSCHAQRRSRVPRGVISATRLDGCVLEACEPSGRGRSRFGLVNVPVKLYSATEDHDVSLHQVHDDRRRAHPVPAHLRDRRQGRASTSTSPRPTTTASARSSSPTTTSQSLPGRAQPRDRGRRVRAERPDRPDHVRPQLLPRARLDVVEGVRAAAPRPSSRPTAPRSCSSRCGRRRRLAALRVRGDVLVRADAALGATRCARRDFPSLDEAVKISAKELDLSKQLVESLVVGLRARAVRRRVPGGAAHAHRRRSSSRATPSTRRRPSASSPKRRRAARSSTSWRRCASRSRRSARAAARRRVRVVEGGGHGEEGRGRPARRSRPRRRAPRSRRPRRRRRRPDTRRRARQGAALRRRGT